MKEIYKWMPIINSHAMRSLKHRSHPCVWVCVFVSQKKKKNIDLTNEEISSPLDILAYKVSNNNCTNYNSQIMKALTKWIFQDLFFTSN